MYYLFLLAGSLQDRHIKCGDVIYAIFTPKENLMTAPPQKSVQQPTETYGTDTVRCHIMLRVRSLCTEGLLQLI